MLIEAYHRFIDERRFKNQPDENLCSTDKANQR